MPPTRIHWFMNGPNRSSVTSIPSPDRILHFTELIVQDYLAQEMCDRRPPKGTFDLFATEGGTAAMCYVFDSLQENFLLNQGDSIALMIPVFTPYIEIPELRRYQFDVTEISADQMTPDGLHTWQYKDEDIDKPEESADKSVVYHQSEQSAQLRAQSGNSGTHHPYCKE